MTCGWDGGWEAKLERDIRKLWVDNGHVCYLGCGPGDFTGVYVYQNLSNYIYVN